MIKIENLSKKFKENVLFKDFSCQINDHDFIAITGVSGCGKTTLLNMLGLLDLDYQGYIYYDHVDIHRLNNAKRAEFIRKNINYLFQNYALIDDETVEENLMLTLYYTKMSKDEKLEKIKHALQEVGLSEALKMKVYALSGGEQQRIALARCMLKPGNIILADEPTGNLDEKNKRTVMNILKQLHKTGKTIIVVTHDMEIAHECERIIELTHEK